MDEGESVALVGSKMVKMRSLFTYSKQEKSLQYENLHYIFVQYKSKNHDSDFQEHYDMKGLSNMKNIFFSAEEITENDLYFLSHMIERIARKLHQRNKYVVNSISKEEWLRLICLADVLHCENPKKLEDEWIKEYGLQPGDFDVLLVDTDLVQHIPTATQMGKVY